MQVQVAELGAAAELGTGLPTPLFHHGWETWIKSMPP